MLAETDTIQARGAMSLAAAMTNMAVMCQGSVKKPLNQVSYMHALAVDARITNRCSRLQTQFSCAAAVGYSTSYIDPYAALRNKSGIVSQDPKESERFSDILHTWAS